MGEQRLFRASYFDRVQALGPLLQLELDRLAFVQRTIPIRLDRGKMNKDIFTGRALYESVPFCPVEPLDYTFFFHCHSPYELPIKRSRWMKTGSR